MISLSKTCQRLHFPNTMWQKELVQPEKNDTNHTIHKPKTLWATNFAKEEKEETQKRTKERYHSEHCKQVSVIMHTRNDRSLSKFHQNERQSVITNTNSIQAIKNKTNTYKQKYSEKMLNLPESGIKPEEIAWNHMPFNIVIANKVNQQMKSRPTQENVTTRINQILQKYCAIKPKHNNKNI